MRLRTITAREARAVVAVPAVALTMTCWVCPAFTTSTAPRAHAADANYQSIQEPDAGYSPIIGLISSAARSVHITMYELTDPAAVNALVDAHRRGVDTKVILDAAFHGHATNAETFQELSGAGVDVKWAPNPAWRDAALTTTAEPIVKGGTLYHLPHPIRPVIPRIAGGNAHLGHAADVRDSACSVDIDRSLRFLPPHMCLDGAAACS
jgi:PLD-like domain